MSGVDAGELHRWTAGNPFFVTEVLAAGAGLVPHAVRDAVLARAARLSGAARDMLDAAAVVPGPAELWLLEALAPAPAEALDECLNAGMLVQAGGRVEFRHEIARQVVEESLPPGRRAGLHRTALGALAGRAGSDLAWLAHHAEAAGDADAGDALRLLAIQLGTDGALAEARAAMSEAVAVLEEHPAGLPEPYRLEITGDAEGAARWWQERGCSYEAALALAGSGDQAALRRALDTFHELGSRPAAAVVARRLRALGEQSMPRGPRPTTAANPAGLTSRQAEVLELLTAGLSNAQIAAQLVLSGRTVDHHVAAILRKLGARTRGEASAQAARLGLTAPRPPAAGGNGHHPAHQASPAGRASWPKSGPRVPPSVPWRNSYGAQVLAPAIAAPLVSQLGGYPTLYRSAAVVTVLGSALVWKIRSVR